MFCAIHFNFIPLTILWLRCCSFSAQEAFSGVLGYIWLLIADSLSIVWEHCWALHWKFIADTCYQLKKREADHLIRQSQFELHLVLLLSKWLFLLDGNELFMKMYFWLSCTWHFNETWMCSILDFYFLWRQMHMVTHTASWILSSHSKERNCEKK